MEQQTTLGFRSLGQIFKDNDTQHIFLVHGNSFNKMPVKEYLLSLPIEITHFTNFSVNPLYEEVCEGVERFKESGATMIVAIGGGSAMDVAKGIKIFSNLDKNKSYYEQEWSDTGIPVVCVPTTAGSGSESTRYSVLCYKGAKQSVVHDSIFPNYAVLDYTLLNSLPKYQKACTVLDALSHAIESWWSINSNTESIELSKKAVALIINHYHDYVFNGTATDTEQIMLASNLAGLAINITQTTAAHAMSYKLTSHYDLPHGYAVAICLPVIWRLMTANMAHCHDIRGQQHLLSVFEDIAHTLGCNDIHSSIARFEALLDEMGLERRLVANQQEIDLFTKSVNIEKLKNTPITLTESMVKEIYTTICRTEK